jgi:hypothetical protein
MELGERGKAKENERALVIPWLFLEAICVDFSFFE